MIQIPLLLCVLSSGATAELSGRVVDPSGQPVAGAIVVISTAKPRVGPATTCPSCYRDCAKRSLTDTEGRFVFQHLSPDLLFRLAAGASGFQGSLSEHYDPAAQPDVVLSLTPLPSAPGVTRAAGKVVDQQGHPIAGAEVRGRTIYRTNGTASGSDASVTPLTLTDSLGVFQLTTGDHIASLDLRATASGYAPSETHWRRMASEPLTITLGRGASIRGRLTSDGVPLAEVEVGIVQDERSIGNLVTPAEVSTDSAGVFQFDQLPPDMDYALYTHIGQNAKAVLPVNLVHAPQHGQRAELGDVPTQAPSRLTVTVRTDDGTPLPPNSSVYLGRYNAWRGSEQQLARTPSASVQWNDLGKEQFAIALRVPGQKVVQSNPSLAMDLNRRYGVRISGDTEVVFVVRKADAAPLPPAGGDQRKAESTL